MEPASKTYLPNADAADFLGLSPRTLERMRIDGRGPIFLKLGRRVVYARADLVAWAETRRRSSTSDLGQPAPTQAGLASSMRSTRT
jgi:hypothetical protein